MDPHPLCLSVGTICKACHLSPHPPMGRSCHTLVGDSFMYQGFN